MPKLIQRRNESNVPSTRSRSGTGSMPQAGVVSVIDLERISAALGVAEVEEAALVRDRLLARQPYLRVRAGADRIREPRDHAERRRDVRGVAERLARHARIERAARVELRRLERHRLEEAKRLAEARVDRRGLVVVEHRIDELPVTQGIRRDRAVRLRSERAL